jgi:hypothetical protein
MGQWKFNSRHRSDAYITCGPNSEHTATCFLDVPEERDWPSAELWCLRMVSKLVEPDWIEEYPQAENPQALVLRVYGLLLIRTGQIEDEYARVGVVKLDFDSIETSRVREITVV